MFGIEIVPLYVFVRDRGNKEITSVLEDATSSARRSDNTSERRTKTNYLNFGDT